MEEDLLPNDNLENEKLEALKQFIKIDLEIKNELMKLAPTLTDDFDESTRIAYVDKVYDSLKDFEYQFQSSLKGFKMGKDVDESIKNFFRKLKENLAIGSFDKGACQTIFQRCFSSMSKRLIENVKENFIGYTEYGESELIQLINQVGTINELLHICHSYIMNNERILSSITKLGEKKNDYGYPIRLFGERTEISEDLFEKFPLNLDVGWTDIVAIQNQILMMVRDRGHALTLDIDTSQDKIFVKYFIPKICNEDMIIALPGVDENNLSGNGASGSFECEKQDFLEKLFGFIERVPMDSDIPLITEPDNFADTKIIDDGKPNIEMEPFFSIEEVKELTVKEGENGIKFEKIKALEYRIKRFFRSLKPKTNDEKGVNKDER